MLNLIQSLKMDNEVEHDQGAMEKRHREPWFRKGVAICLQT
jgi:hypothetical protein